MTGPKRVAALVLDRLGLLPLAMDLYQGIRGRVAWGPRGAIAPAELVGGLAVPGPLLRQSSAGTADLRWFLEGGRLARQSIEEGLRAAGVELRSIGAMLDLGCGCGRVLRQWAELRGLEIHGTDYNRRAVAWCRRNLPFARIGRNGLRPPLSYADGSFDLVYALSVFTHLTEPGQRAWMAELHRVLRPGGHLLLTTHGRAYLDQLTPGEREAFERGELVVRAEEAAGTNLCGSYHPRGWLESAFHGQFEPVLFTPEGALGNPPQDLHVLRRRP